MKKNRKIYVIGRDDEYANWMRGELVNTIEEADLVVLSGGEDVSPIYYGEKKHRHTYTNNKRDIYEIGLAKKAIELGIPIVGICRGSQLSAVLSGAKLVQHQDNPYSFHKIYTSTGKEIVITSSHHQAQMPYNLPIQDYKILGWTNNISKYHENGEEKEIYNNGEKEVEICYYKKTKCLAIQGHPEWMEREKYPETFEYLDNLLDKHLNNEL